MRKTKVWTAYELLMIDRLAAAYMPLVEAIDAVNAPELSEGETVEAFEARVKPQTDAVEAAAAVYARAVDTLLRYAELVQREEPWHAFYNEVSGFVLADLVDDATGKLSEPDDLLARYFVDLDKSSPLDMMGVPVALDARAVAGVLLSGLNGIRHWCKLVDVVEPAAGDLRLHLGERPVATVDYPLSPGGALLLHERQPSGTAQPRRVDRDAIERALRIMAAKYPATFTRIVGGNHDERTGDALLQLAAFERLIYA